MMHLITVTSNCSQLKIHGPSHIVLTRRAGYMMIREKMQTVQIKKAEEETQGYPIVARQRVPQRCKASMMQIKE